MIQAIKNNLVVILAGLSLLFAGSMAMVPATVSAQNIDGALRCGSNLEFRPGGDCATRTGGGGGVMTVIRNIINIFSVIVGAVAVIMIIFGGFKYITSGGDSNNIGSAKNTILYAIVGLVIVALAQAIVQFVLTEI